MSPKRERSTPEQENGDPASTPTIEENYRALRAAQLFALLSLVGDVASVLSGLTSKLFLGALTLMGVLAVVLGLVSSIQLRRRSKGIRRAVASAQISPQALVVGGLLLTIFSAIGFTYSLTPRGSSTGRPANYQQADIIIGTFQNARDSDYKVTSSVRNAIESAMARFPEATAIYIDEALPEFEWKARARDLLKRHGAHAIIWGNYGVTSKVTRLQLFLAIDSIVSDVTEISDSMQIIDSPVSELDSFQTQDSLARSIAATSLTILAMSHIRTKNFDQAYRYFEDALQIVAPSSKPASPLERGLVPTLEVALGTVDFLKERWARSIEHLDKALLYPDVGEVHKSVGIFLKGWDYYYLKQNDMAFKLFASCLTDPTFGRSIDSFPGELQINFGGFSHVVDFPTLWLLQTRPGNEVASIEIGPKLADRALTRRFPMLKELASVLPSARIASPEDERDIKALSVLNDFYLMAKAFQESYPSVSFRSRIEMQGSMLETSFYAPIGSEISIEEFNALQERLGTTIKFRAHAK